MVVFKRLFPWTASRQDPECAHLIKAWSSGKLPRIPVEKAFPEIATFSIVIRKAESRKIGWSLDLQELTHVLCVVQLMKSERILEIGTYDGFTALNLAANVDHSAKIWTVDLPRTDHSGTGISNACSPDIVGSKFRGEPESRKIQQVWADSTKTDWVSFGAPFDMVLIDGCHDYSYVRSDSANAINHTCPGGTIFWHDYGQSVDVSRAVDELARHYSIRAIRGTRLAFLKMPARLA